MLFPGEPTTQKNQTPGVHKHCTRDFFWSESCGVVDGRAIANLHSTRTQVAWVCVFVEVSALMVTSRHVQERDPKQPKPTKTWNAAQQ